MELIGRWKQWTAEKKKKNKEKSKDQQPRNFVSVFCINRVIESIPWHHFTLGDRFVEFPGPDTQRKNVRALYFFY